MGQRPLAISLSFQEDYLSISTELFGGKHCSHGLGSIR
jgi:hypothetical protein